MTQNAVPPEIAKLSFEDALGELESLVRALETGDSKLDTAIDAYTRGTQLRQHCEAKLREAKARIDKIKVGADGSVGTEPVEDH